MQRNLQRLMVEFHPSRPLEPPLICSTCLPRSLSFRPDSTCYQYLQRCFRLVGFASPAISLGPNLHLILVKFKCNSAHTGADSRVRESEAFWYE